MKSSEIKAGRIFHNLRIIECLGSDEKHVKYYLCECILCGKRMKISIGKLGKTKMCVDCKRKQQRRNIMGMRFGRLLAVECIGVRGKSALWRCICDCGNERVVMLKNLTSGNTKSCGCIKPGVPKGEVAGEHRGSSVSPAFKKAFPHYTKHPLYVTWAGMVSRGNSQRAAVKGYFDRGIRVCKRWLPENQGFENFLNDMGEKPSPQHSLDRIDVNGDYCPENCRWATKKEQSNNRNCNVLYTFNGKTQTMAQWCDELGVNYGVVASRKHRGYIDFYDLFYGKGNKPTEAI